jgi:hypothetical protein
MEETSLSSLAAILHLASPNKDALKAINSILVSDSTIPAFHDEYVSAEPKTVATLQDLRKQGPDGLPPVYDDASATPAQHGSYTPTELRIFSNLVDAIEAADINMKIKLAPHVDDDFKTGLLPIIDRLGLKGVTQDSDPIALYESRQTPWITSELHDHKLVEAGRRNILLAADKVLWIKATTGRFPAALPGDSTDPFDGKPLQYQRLNQFAFALQTSTPHLTYYDRAGDEHPLKSSAIKFDYPGPMPVREYDGPWPPPIPGAPLPKAISDEISMW